MSSLRLALKQSLEDAPPAAITTTTATTATTTAEDAASVASSSSSSSENEASLHDFHDDDADDDDESTTSSSELHRQKQHVAAHKIQNQYRKNKKPIRTKKNQQKKSTKRAEKASKTMKKMQHNNNNDDDQSSQSSSTNTTPVNTVQAPSQHRIAHMHSLSVEDCRRHVCVGLRVKVQFDSSEWYGGRVSAVSKGDRNRIRIRYDDGTTEIATFPDRNNNNSRMDAIVVDEQENGRHAEAARNASEFFEPKSNTEEKSIFAPDNHDDEEEGELMESPTTKSKQIATILQKHQVAAAPTSPQQRTPVEVIQANHASTENSITASAVPLQIPKKKRGRPPKHPRPEITSTGPTDNMTMMTTTMTGTGAALPDSKTEASASMNVSSVSRLNIRIPNRTKAMGSPMGGDTPHTAAESAPASPSSTRKTADHSQQSMNAIIDSSIVQRKRKQGDIITEEKQSQPENPAPIKKLIIKIPKEKVKKNLQEEHASVTYQQKQREGGGDTPRNKIKIKKSFSSDDAFVVKSPQSPSASSVHPQTKAEEPMAPASSVSPRASKKTKVAHISSPTSKASPNSRKKTLSTTAASSMDIEIEATSTSPDETHLRHLLPQEQATPKSFPPSSTKPGVMQVCSSPIEGNKADHAMVQEQVSSNFTESTVSDAKESGPPTRLGSTSTNLAMQEGNQGAETVSFPPPHLVESQRDSLEPTTPLHSTPSTEDFSFEGIVRSERQAAQKANERIVAKHDAAQESPVKKKKKRRKDGEVIGDDLPTAASTSTTHLAPQMEDESQWVQCDSCGKWRIIPGSVVKNLPKQWYCSDNIHDPKRATCEAPEQTAKDILREKKRMKKRQQKLLEKAAAGEAAAGIEKTVLVGSTSDVSQPLLEKTESDSAQPLKKKVIDHARSPRPSKPEKAIQKAKRARTPVIDEMGASDSSNQKPDKKLTMGKKGRSVENFEKIVQADSEVVVKRGRGRPRGSRTTKESSAPTAPVEDAENLEWVQCEKCEKWRKLPPHISADELPDVWYCELNTWNPASASCEAPEDKAEGVLDVGGFGNSGVSAGKLTYRNLIFGSTGRKPNRPISEKMRAAESLFSTGLEEDEAPSRVLYADSSAYVSRGRPNLVNENDGRLVLEMMSRSFLWQELKNTQRMMNHVQPATLTFETIPPELQQPLREYLLHILGKYTLTGDEVVEHAQAMEKEILRDEYKKVQPYCTKNVVITALCELVKDGSVDCIQKIGLNWTVQDWKPLFRRALRKTPVANKHLEPPSVRVHSLSRCMKISKPWKLAKTW